MDNSAEIQKLIEKAAMVLSAKIKKHKVKEVQDVLSSEFPVDYPITDTRMSALSFASSLTENSEEERKRNGEILTAIFQCNPNPNYEDNFKRTPLHLASISGNKTAVEMLLATGNVNIDAATTGGETPLMKAAASGRIEICQILLNAGANCKLACNNNMTALHFAQIN